MELNLDEIKEKNFKSKVLLSLILILSLTLILRLFYLQIIKYKSYAQRAQYATSKISILTAPRGIIYDRNGKILAANKQAISVVVYPNKLKTIKEKLYAYNNLAKILKTNPYNLKEIFLKLPSNAPLPVRLQSNISTEEAIQIVENGHLLPGISIQEDPIRFYPNGPLGSHILGYISQIDEDELSKRQERKLGDLVGKDGIEKLYDDILRGIDGKDIVEVDRFGKPLNPDYKQGTIHIDPTCGKNIYLTIDLDLQKSAEEALKESGTNSAIVSVNPNTGEVLALASYPNFDPNIFTRPLSYNSWKELLRKKAFLNRALLGYIPGSIWKPIILISALDAMVIKPNDYFNVSGAYYLGKTRFSDWTDKKATLSLKECLGWSRDTAFYQIGKKLTPEEIKKWGTKLGAGKKSGIELLGEEEGIVPDTKWKKKYTGEPWYPGNTLHYAIGQSFLLVTPLQVARIYSGLATENKIPKLQLVKQIHSYVKPLPAPETFKIDPSILKVVKDGLEFCVEKGTGAAAMIEGIKVAGKTGSAEVHSTAKTHGWFAAYAPIDKPEIVIVVLAERAGHGGSIAAPIAKKVLEAYFHLDKPKSQLAKT